MGEEKRNGNVEAGRDKVDTMEKLPAGQNILFLTTEEFQDIYQKAAEIGAQEALKKFEQERKREYAQRTDKRLRNTKLLLRTKRVHECT